MAAARTAPAGDADIARVAALIGDRTRARVMIALGDGRALPASVLAAEAGVSASTISEHLSQLVAADLLRVRAQGRSRYFSLAGPAVGEALEALAVIAPAEPIRSLRQGTRAHALRRSRTCYGHLAGRLGVALMSALIDAGLLGGGDGRHHPELASEDRLSAPGRDLSYRLTSLGEQRLADFGVDVDAVLRRRPAVRYCLDWSEQHHHLAGPLGTAVTTRLFERDWIVRGPQRRVVRLTESGAAGLHRTFGLPLDWDTEAAAS